MNCNQMGVTRFYLFLTGACMVVITTRWMLIKSQFHLLCDPVNQFSHIQIKKKADYMSAEEIYSFLHWTNSTSCLFAVDFGYWLWIGGGMAAPDGHKAVCLDQLISPVYNNCLVYSFGINNQWTFDEAMAKFGCQVYSFDPSMGVSDHNRTDKIHFYNLGLGSKNELDPTRGWKMKTASSIYQMLTTRHGNTTPVDILKLDIEFSEWEVIPQMLKSAFLTNKVKQLAIEIHFEADDSLEKFRYRVGILQHLESTEFSSNEAGGFVRFSSRPNPGLKRKIAILAGKEEYIGLELAWYNSRFYYTSSNENDASLFPYYD